MKDDGLQAPGPSDIWRPSTDITIHRRRSIPRLDTSMTFVTIIYVIPSREVIMIVYEPSVVTDVGDSFQWLH